MKFINTNACTFCIIENETIQHLFRECTNIRNFWIQLESSICELIAYNFDIKEAKDISFGKLGAMPVLNLGILCGTYFIYLCKLRSEIPVPKGILNVHMIHTADYLIEGGKVKYKRSFVMCMYHYL